MHLLQAGVNLIYIRDLLGHADVSTTEIYARANAEAKRKAIESAYQPLTRYGIYKIIRRHASRFDDPRTGRRVSPHTFRHYVEGRVMWPAASSPLVAEPRVLVPAT